MAYQWLIRPTLTPFQPAKLLTVAEDRLDRPTAALAQYHVGHVARQVVADQVLVVAVTVSGHDQRQVSVLGRKDPHGCRAHPQLRPPSQLERPCQLAHRLLAAAPDHA